MLSDEENTYTYNHANQLTSWTNGPDINSFAYNGLGDRLQQTVNSVITNYTLDLNVGLTQVLSDGTNSYLYGFGRIGEQAADWAYHLPDALGSVRQLADATGVVSYAASYEPYGEVLTAGGNGASSYGFAGEWTDATGLQYLRTRYYTPEVGRFASRDTWLGDAQNPMSYNYWLYAYANPTNLTDPSGRCPDNDGDGECNFIGLTSGLSRSEMNVFLEDIGCQLPPQFEPLPGTFNLSAYYITNELAYTAGAKVTGQGLNGESFNEYFLYSDQGVCMQGTGITADGRYISCTSLTKRSLYENPFWMPTNKEMKEFRFSIHSEPQNKANEAFETVAVCPDLNMIGLPPDARGNVEIRISSNEGDFERVLDLLSKKDANNIFTITDSGGALCGNPKEEVLPSIDVFVGVQQTYDGYHYLEVDPFIQINSAVVEWRYIK